MTLLIASSQYWIIDAFDECKNTGARMGQTLGSLLAKIDSILPLKVFISSRPTPDAVQLFDSLQPTVVPMSYDNTANDIRRYVESSRSLLPVQDEDTRKDLVEEIIEKSHGCFLWVQLVITQLEDCYLSEEIEDVLENVPEELDELYSQNLKAISADMRPGKPVPPKNRLAKTILTWVICAVRPLSINELKSAIRLEFESDVVRDLETSIPALCAHLVYVDNQGHVQIIHQTARAFLTSHDLDSYFQITPGEGHVQLATACLKYLSSKEMEPLRRHRRSTTTQRPAKDPIASYAIRAFTEHLARAGSSSDKLFQQLTVFLRTNVLVWIEELARARDLSRMISAATHFKSYLARRAKHVPSLKDDVSLWSRDLPRIVTEFGRNLLDYPAGIHGLIPPFCPRNSIIHIRFASQSSGIQLLGLTEADWHDRICCHYYKDRMTKCVASMDQRYAVGLANGMIRVYNTSTCEQVIKLYHGDSVRLLSFSPVAQNLASAGFKNVIVWDLPTGRQLLRIDLTSMAMAIAFSDTEPFVTVVTRSTEVSTWSLLSKNQLTSRTPKIPPEAGDSLESTAVPTIVEISTESNMLAMYYRARPLLVYDLQSLDFLGACQGIAGNTTGALRHKTADVNQHITSIVFNPKPELQRLAIAYWDGAIDLIDTDSFKIVRSTRSDSQTLTASPDGRTLAGGSSSGKIQIFDCETLEHIYSAVPSSDGVTAMAFTGDSRRLLDNRAYQVNVWEPSVLTRNSIDDNSSEPSDAISLALEEIHLSHRDHSEPIITAIICCYEGTKAICGKSNGAVEMYDIAEDKSSCWQLYKSGAMEVSVLEWNEEHKLVGSADMSGRFQVVRLGVGPTQRPKGSKMVLKRQLEHGVSISQLLISASGMQLLVSSSMADQVWCLTTGKLLRSYSHADRTNWKWFQHPFNSQELLKVQDAHVQYYHWNAFQQLSEPVQIHDLAEEEATVEIEHGIVIEYNGTVALKVLVYKAAETVHNIRNAHLYTIALPVHHGQQASLLAKPIFQSKLVSSKPDIDLLIGTVITVLGGRLLIFTSNTGWICSIDLNIPFPHDSFQRHFFVPFAWLSSAVRVLAKVSERGDILFVHGREIAVARNGLEELETVQLED